MYSVSIYIYGGGTVRLELYFSLLYINFGLMVDENKGNEI